ncbi:MAG: hypothetical protein RLZZ106_1997, partial [Cyanobacteriota bacterium]
MSGIAGTLEGVTDANVLFLLSADTTPEEVREWFMERCAAGDPPSRKEVQERKRTASSPRQPQPAAAAPATARTARTARPPCPWW